MLKEKTQRLRTLPILTYHAIEDGDGPLSVSPRRFAEHLEAISSLGYATTALERSVNRLYRWENHSVDREIAITFDDGYASVLTEAMPLLERFGFKATLFVISDLVGCRLEGRELLGWRDISALSKAGVEIGSHTATHAMLTQLNLAGIYREVGDSKRRIEDHLGKAVRYFAYPRGLATSRVRRVVVECGYVGACSTVAGSNTNRSNPYFLRRRELYDHDNFQGAIAKLRGKGDRLHNWVSPAWVRRMRLSEKLEGGCPQLVRAVRKLK